MTQEWDKITFLVDAGDGKPCAPESEVQPSETAMQGFGGSVSFFPCPDHMRVGAAEEIVPL